MLVLEVAPLDGVVVEVSGAIEELRELARGVRPAGLDDGLGHALHAAAGLLPALEGFLPLAGELLERAIHLGQVVD